MKIFNTDIAIVGGGAAGMAAAVAAAQEGEKVIILEKMNACGGNGLFPMGLAAVGSYLQKSLNIKADADDMFRQVMAYSHWNADPRLNRVLIDRSGETIKWLSDMGVNFTNVIAHYPGQNPPVYHTVSGPGNTGRVVIRRLVETFKKLDGKILNHTRGRQLLFDKGGAVQGILAETDKGEQIRVDASAVIVATGGFAGNDDLLGRLIPDYDPKDYLYIHGARPEGDGFIMMEQAGARVDRNIAIAGGAPQITAKRTAVSRLIARPYSIWLNIHGERFADEMVVYDMALGVNVLRRQPEKICYVILDSEVLKRINDEGRDPMEQMGLPPGVEERFDEDYQRCVDEGYAVIADTLGEIARFMGVPAKKIKESIEEYNSFCAKGRDAMFCKDPRLMMPVKTPPYYVIKAGIDQLFTWGGVVINHRFQVLDSNMQPIKGLYSAGNDAAGGIDGDTYNFAMSGHAFGYSVIGGRIAGENASEVGRKME
ncbi:MAG: FAD-binding protein [Deltaproteobacteria bacterium]|nr:FAD-binding protein [Deltaproteobacteria bacterium]